MSIEDGGYIPPEAKDFKPNNNMTKNIEPASSINEAVKKFLEKREQEGEAAKQYLAEILAMAEKMQVSPASSNDLQTALADKITELKTTDPELGGMLERKLNDTDTTTGIPKRDSQNDGIRSEIFKRIKEGGNEEYKTLGMVSFDLRSLKLLNDAVSNHEVGDEYLNRIATKATELSKKIAELLGVDFTISRDGGDEFSVVFTSENIDLNQNLDESNSQLKNLLADGQDTKNIRIIDAISKYLEQEIGKETHNDLFLEGKEKDLYDILTKKGKTAEAESFARKQMKIKLENFVNQGIEDETLHFKMPDNFDLHSFVAAGGSTLYEIINNPNQDDYKTYETPKSEMHALNILLGAMRGRSDKESYRQKDLQNQEISRGKDEVSEFRIGLLSRNEFTRSIIVEKKKLERELKNCLANKEN